MMSQNVRYGSSWEQLRTAKQAKENLRQRLIEADAEIVRYKGQIQAHQYMISRLLDEQRIASIIQARDVSSELSVSIAHEIVAPRQLRLEFVENLACSVVYHVKLKPLPRVKLVGEPVDDIERQRMSVSVVVMNVNTDQGNVLDGDVVSQVDSFGIASFENLKFVEATTTRAEPFVLQFQLFIQSAGERVPMYPPITLNSPPISVYSHSSQLPK